MKRLIGCALALALVVGGCPGFTKTTHAHGFQISFGFFFHRLSPYGRWVYVPRYGQVWYPVAVGSYWQPYINGYWAYTEYGWTWVSYDEFGWITFHYGAWDWLPSYGWVWVPGYVWAPAWVTWRYGPRYLGWAPLPPDYGFYYYGSYCPPVTVFDRAWVFVPTDYVGAYNISDIRLPSHRNVEFLDYTKPITNITVVKDHVVNQGPVGEGFAPVGQIKVRKEKLEQLGIKPQPIGDLPSSRQVTVATPYKSREVKELDDYPRGDRTIYDGYGGGEGDASKSEKSIKGDRPFDDRKPVDQDYRPKPEKPIKGDRPFEDRKPVDQDYRPKPEKPWRSGGEDKFDPGRPYGNQEGYPDRKYRVDPAPESKAGSSDDRFSTRPEPGRAPVQKPVDQPRTWPGTRADDDVPAYGKMPPRTYETPSQRYPSRPETVKPSPSDRGKSDGDPSVYRDQEGGSVKTPRHMYRPPEKIAPVRPEGSPGSQGGAPAKKGKQ